MDDSFYWLSSLGQLLTDNRLLRTALGVY